MIYFKEADVGDDRYIIIWMRRRVVPFITATKGRVRSFVHDSERRVAFLHSRQQGIVAVDQNRLIVQYRGQRIDDEQLEPVVDNVGNLRHKETCEKCLPKSLVSMTFSICERREGCEDLWSIELHFLGYEDRLNKPSLISLALR